MGVKSLTFVDNSPPACDAVWLNSVEDEINNIIESVGLVASESDLNQLGKSISIYAAGANFYTDSGTSTAYVLTPVGLKKAPAAYFAGMSFRCIIGNTNTSTTPTINVNGIGAINIKSRTGGTIAIGDLVINTEVAFTFDGTDARINTGGALPIASVLSAMMPVGFVVSFKDVATNPNTIYGFGTWVAITDKVLMARGGTYGASGGAATVTLTTAELPAHTHVQTAPNASGGTNNFPSVDSGNDNGGSNTTQSITSSTGSGAAFSIIPPYQGLYVWERTV